MAISGMKGKVYYDLGSCPTYDLDTGVWTIDASSTLAYPDEVTNFTITDSVQKREFGHDKSGGWQDVCAGTRRVGIVLSAMLNVAETHHLHAGQVLYTELYPTSATGVCNTPAAGYVMVDQISRSVDIETGQPVGYTVTLSSKGPWTGLGGLDGRPWGGFECECSGA
jgi:hypothetical protein